MASANVIIARRQGEDLKNILSYISKYPSITFWILLAALTPYILKLLGLWDGNDLLKRLAAMVLFYAAVFVLFSFVAALWKLFYP